MNTHVFLTAGVMMAVASQLFSAQENVSGGGAALYPHQINLGCDSYVSNKSMNETPIDQSDTIYVTSLVQFLPHFPGGEAAMLEWIKANLHYPEAALEEGEQGIVTVGFLIDCDGSLKDVKVVHSKHPTLDKEAVRLVKSMPNWFPGLCNGEPVAVSYVIPVIFRLPNK